MTITAQAHRAGPAAGARERAGIPDAGTRPGPGRRRAGRPATAGGTVPRTATAPPCLVRHTALAAFRRRAARRAAGRRAAGHRRDHRAGAIRDDALAAMTRLVGQLAAALDQLAVLGGQLAAAGDPEAAEAQAEAVRAETAAAASSTPAPRPPGTPPPGTPPSSTPPRRAPPPPRPSP